ncbi:MAG: hypothetical protein Q8922_15405 [Bacteroidota bacterium]|nr:hypothetical protein [Bacteroidota bacterium]MDP4234779.1 hypothetical protein [Bacteroidota bacterium]MDP4244141.1 hypothetical protein [Bacteroidota bacterium]MDP4289303.1 hypothetical protein [Bacteroidota bacterium]
MFDITPVHWHLLVNHLPVEGSMVALLLLIYAFIRNNAELKRAALIACVVTGAAAFAANFTGDDAADVARAIPGVERSDIRAHNESADWACDAAYLLAGVAAVGLVLAWRKKSSPDATSDALAYARHHKEPPPFMMIATLIVALLTVTIMARTSYLGGSIRHPEIEAGFKPPPTVDTSKDD